MTYGVPKGWTGKWVDIRIAQGKASARVHLSSGAWTLVRSVEGEPDIKTRHDSRAYAIRQGRWWITIRSNSARCPTCLGRGHVQKEQP